MLRKINNLTGVMKLEPCGTTSRPIVDKKASFSMSRVHLPTGFLSHHFSSWKFLVTMSTMIQEPHGESRLAKLGEGQKVKPVSDDSCPCSERVWPAHTAGPKKVDESILKMNLLDFYSHIDTISSLWVNDAPGALIRRYPRIYNRHRIAVRSPASTSGCTQSLLLVYITIGIRSKLGIPEIIREVENTTEIQLEENSASVSTREEPNYHSSIPCRHPPEWKKVVDSYNEKAESDFNARERKRRQAWLDKNHNRIEGYQSLSRQHDHALYISKQYTNFPGVRIAGISPIGQGGRFKKCLQT
ncbi:hypothetical protein BCON_0368g00020 [Botryotinia convoluta]|uniref:Uncharacterized protein n=1 Tax=Botryotinia convoluta TaxID=54673 RepID=A0A4Z1HG22_9HELO|nr:hypothetical protein BCON_0368g00020 [Botryotinia convoluta]